MLAAGLLLATLTLTSPGETAPKWTTAAQAHAAGAKAYTEGRYKNAVEAFGAAYALDPAPALLANLGEAYSRAGDCGRALEHYDRFLSVAPKGPARSDIAARANALRPTCPTPAASNAVESPGAKPRLGVAAPPAAPTNPAPADATPTGTSRTRPGPPAHEAQRWQVALEGGVGFLRWGEARATMPTVRLGVHHTWWWSRLGLAAGAAVQWSRFGYGSAAFAPEAFEASAQTWSTMAEVQFKLRILEGLTARLDGGVGALFLSSLRGGSTIAEQGAGSSGSAVLAVRGGLGVEITLPVRGLTLQVTPVGVTFAPKVEGGMGSRLDLRIAAGVGYGF